MSQRISPASSLVVAVLLAILAEAAVVLDISHQRPMRATTPPITLGARTQHAGAAPSAALPVASPCPPSRPSPGRTALVEAVVNEQGRVESACVVLSVSPDFDQQALAFVTSQRFAPALHEGKPVKVLLRASVFAHPR